MASHYSQKGFFENRLGLHYRRFWAFVPSPLPETAYGRFWALGRYRSLGDWQRRPGGYYGRFARQLHTPTRSPSRGGANWIRDVIDPLGGGSRKAGARRREWATPL